MRTDRIFDVTRSALNYQLEIKKIIGSWIKNLMERPHRIYRHKEKSHVTTNQPKEDDKGEGFGRE